MQQDSRQPHPLDDVAELLGAGDVEAAETMCRERLRSRPDDVNLQAMLGAILLKRRQYGEAERALRRSVQLAPEFAKPHEDLGSLQLDLGRPDEAIACFRKAVELDARQPTAFLGLATALARSGKTEEAEQARERFLELSPVARALTEAAQLVDQGKLKRAEAVCGEVLIDEPRNTRALRLLSRISAARERYPAAEALLRRVIDIAPDHWLGYSDLAQFFIERSRPHEAIKPYRDAIARQQTLPDLPLQLADTLSLVGRAEEALEAYESCLALDGKRLPALLGRGHMLRILGRRDEAVSSYRRAIELHPASGDAWWNLASMKGYRFSAEDVQTMRTLLDSDDTTPSAKIALQFALARSLEADGNYAKAWEYYCTANTARRTEVSYDPVDNEQQTDLRMRVFNQELFRENSSVSPDGPVPIFIVGMPRSGSTLIEQILASHSQVDGCGELPYIIMAATALGQGEDAPYPDRLQDLPRTELLALGEEYLDRTRYHHSPDATFFTDKMPANFAHIGLIHLILPQAVIVDARRDPLDTCVANFRQLFAQGKNQTYDLQELAEYYLQYLRIMAHWDEVLPGQVLRVQYERVVADLETEVHRLLDHCGLPFEPACLEFHRSSRSVNTASSEQVRQPIYKDAVGFWRHYEEQLAELREIFDSECPEPSRPNA